MHQRQMKNMHHMHSMHCMHALYPHMYHMHGGIYKRVDEEEKRELCINQEIKSKKIRYPIW